MKRNNTQTETRKNIRNNSGSQYNRKSKSAKKSKETIKDYRKVLYNKNNLRNFKSEYDNKKKKLFIQKLKMK